MTLVELLNKIESCGEGFVYSTVRGLSFTIKRHGNGFDVFRDGRQQKCVLTLANLEQALSEWPVAGPSYFSSNIFCNSYIYSILSMHC
ncbi:MAG: hypothetical protein LBM99_04845 [Bacillales bacterium]|jgi:hypothetical protein|nr:hypothetical protein [Bacillales bacterium]